MNNTQETEVFLMRKIEKLTKACTYEKLVKKPEFGEHERVYLQFHSVNASAKVMP